MQRKLLGIQWNKFQFILLVLITLFRAGLSTLLGIWYPSEQVYDDQLLVNYAKLNSHFHTSNQLSMVKTLGYPIFLDAVYLSGLSYVLVVTIIWIIAAVLTTKLFTYATQNKLFLAFVYIFVLFTPAAFDSWLGTRLYRNSIIAPFVWITFVLMFLILIKLILQKNIVLRNLAADCMVLSIVFFFTYYIKEDGMWMLPGLLIFVLSAILILWIKHRKYLQNKTEITKPNSEKKYLLTATVFISLPVLFFALFTQAYKAVNYHYFGVYAIDTRTDGELGRFVKNIYKIYSSERTKNIWAPQDAIDQAFAVSPTLNKHMELRDRIINTPWKEQNPIRGDFLTWVLRTALVDSGLWESEVQVNELFGQINKEIEAAFNSGELKEDSKLQITSFAGGRSWQEIKELFNEILQSYKTTIYLDGYEPGGRWGTTTDLSSAQVATLLTHMNQLDLEGSAYDQRSLEMSIGNAIAAVIFKIYSILNPVLLTLSMVAFFISIVRILRKQNSMEKHFKSICVLFLAGTVMLVGFSLAYAFSVSWFSEYVWTVLGLDINITILKFYTIGMVPLLALTELFGIYMFFVHIQDFINMKGLTAGISKKYNGNNKDKILLYRRNENEKSSNYWRRTCGINGGI